MSFPLASCYALSFSCSSSLAARPIKWNPHQHCRFWREPPCEGGVPGAEVRRGVRGTICHAAAQGRARGIHGSRTHTLTQLTQRTARSHRLHYNSRQRLYGLRLGTVRGDRQGVLRLRRPGRSSAGRGIRVRCRSIGARAGWKGRTTTGT